MQNVSYFLIQENVGKAKHEKYPYNILNKPASQLPYDFLLQVNPHSGVIINFKKYAMFLIVFK